MKKKSPPPLSVEDRKLRKKVAETITPLSQKRGQKLADEMSRLMNEVPSMTEPSSSGTFPLKKPVKKTSTASSSRMPDWLNQSRAGLEKSSPQSHPIEERVVRNLMRGRQTIDARIDLHGMTQDRARFALLDFLQMAQRDDYRIVLVITGKGNEGRGVLRQNVPQWLGTSPFKGLVNGFRPSHASHGGEGALYVRVRKPASRNR